MYGFVYFVYLVGGFLGVEVLGIEILVVVVFVWVVFFCIGRLEGLLLVGRVVGVWVFGGLGVGVGYLYFGVVLFYLVWYFLWV